MNFKNKFLIMSILGFGLYNTLTGLFWPFDLWPPEKNNISICGKNISSKYIPTLNKENVDNVMRTCYQKKKKNKNDLIDINDELESSINYNFERKLEEYCQKNGLDSNEFNLKVLAKKIKADFEENLKNLKNIKKDEIESNFKFFMVYFEDEFLKYDKLIQKNFFQASSFWDAFGQKTIVKLVERKNAFKKQLKIELEEKYFKHILYEFNKEHRESK